MSFRVYLRVCFIGGVRNSSRGLSYCQEVLGGPWDLYWLGGEFSTSGEWVGGDELVSEGGRVQIDKKEGGGKGRNGGETATARGRKCAGGFLLKGGGILSDLTRKENESEGKTSVRQPGRSVSLLCRRGEGKNEGRKVSGMGRILGPKRGRRNKSKTSRGGREKWRETARKSSP